jgi:DNA invertase Pin-like site-specific DNA recombinase
MMYGYARVSTDAQDLSAQLARLKADGWAEVFREKLSYAAADRPQLKQLLKKLDSDNVVMAGVAIAVATR